jgi:hypothetical protein
MRQQGVSDKFRTYQDKIFDIAFAFGCTFVTYFFANNHNHKKLENRIKQNQYF